jgi:hypothetical protein
VACKERRSSTWLTLAFATEVLAQAHGSCEARRVRRILLILRGALDEAAVAQCYAQGGIDGAEVAICYQLPSGLDGLREGLAAQRTLTALLRQLPEIEAETIPVFVACDREGERISDYAAAWGATEVRN